MLLIGNVKVAFVIELEADGVAMQAAVRRRHRGNDLLLAILRHLDDLAAVEQRRVVVAILVDSQALGRVVELCQYPGFILGMRRAGQAKRGNGKKQSPHGILPWSPRPRWTGCSR